MPIYEYECKACGHTFETLQSLSEDPLTDCPACGKAELKKLISAVSFRLKGAGWYETDFKDKNKKNLVDSDTKDSSDTGETKDKPATQEGDKTKSEASDKTTKSETKSSDSSKTEAAKSTKQKKTTTKEGGSSHKNS